jgi:hypothetical protein
MQGVFVLGMHRSGTSAVARLVNLLGIPTCLDEDLLPTTEDNPRGFWESASLAALNDRLLLELGSDWACPPALPAGWEHAPELADLRREAAEGVARVLPAGRWVWKDPRNCVTLPFWLASVETEPVAVLVHRNPLEVAASLETRDGFGTLYSLALWERSLRAGLAALAGLPTLVTTYDDVLAAPLEWCAGVRGFLDGLGVPTSAPAEDEALAFVDGGLRHASSTAEDLRADEAVSGAKRALFDALEGLVGPHDRFPAVELPPESATTEALLAARRQALAERRDLAREHEELEAYARDLGKRFLDLEKHARALRDQHAALEEYARELQARHAALEEYARGLQSRVAEGSS